MFTLLKNLDCIKKTILMVLMSARCFGDILIMAFPCALFTLRCNIFCLCFYVYSAKSAHTFLEVQVVHLAISRTCGCRGLEVGRLL